MANMSDAMGTYKLIGDWTDDDKRILANIFRTLDECEYFTSLDRISQENPFQNNECTFDGCGRWTYNCNLDAFDRWSDLTGCSDEDVHERLQRMFPKTMTVATYTLEKQLLLKRMFENQLSIEVLFKDMESGCDVLYEAEGCLTAIFDMKDGYHLEYDEINITDYTCNLKNYCTLFKDDDRLDDVIFGIQTYFKLSDETYYDIKTIITEDSEWFNIRPWDDYIEDDTDFDWIEPIKIRLTERGILHESQV